MVPVVTALCTATVLFIHRKSPNMQTHIDCIRLSFLHCAISNVSSYMANVLFTHGKSPNMQIHIDCNCLTFLHCAISNVSSYMATVLFIQRKSPISLTDLAMPSLIFLAPRKQDVFAAGHHNAQLCRNIIASLIYMEKHSMEVLLLMCYKERKCWQQPCLVEKINLSEYKSLTHKRWCLRWISGWQISQIKWTSRDMPFESITIFEILWKFYLSYIWPWELWS